MALEDYLHNAVGRLRASFSSSRSGFINYLTKYDLKDYFSPDVPEAQRAQFRNSLEKKLDEHLARYDKELNGLGRKIVSKGTMGLAVANDLYAYVSNVPIANVTGLGYALFAIKTLAEIPALYQYAKKSGDWYGAITHLLLKPVRYLIPVIGPALESGAFERMVRKRVMKEVALDFIREHGEYQPLKDRVQKHLASTTVGDAIYRPRLQTA